MQAQLNKVAELAPDASPDVVAHRLGNGISALSSVPTALASALLAGASVAETIRFALAVGGDTDTIASMAAAITGAHLGVEGVPESWLATLEDKDRLMDLADGLVAASEQDAVV